ncbi:MAG: hypothetical protein LBD88_02055 [Candidatus Peribacteria bacterium]|jgi:hypothetical protein|nr:hypothetical protein [Candidatus Peribacteria bacterium]
MILNNIKLILEQYKEKEGIFKIGYLKEYLQIIILKQIYEYKDSKELIFYG